MNYQELKDFIEKNNFVKSRTKIIGKTQMGNNLYAVIYKKDPSFCWAIITAGIHAREHLSCDLVCEQIKQIGTCVKQINCNIAFLPMINPDGISICTQNLQKFDKKWQIKLKKIENIENNCMFKANANGVDLNNNFDANWAKHFSNKVVPSSQGYYGKKPFSEKESKALAKFTKSIKPFLTISYHLKGEEIYYDFFQTGLQKNRDEQIANIFSQSTGYKIVSTQNVSSGGYKDWCVQKLKIPALTIELGDDKFCHPYPRQQLASIIQKNSGVFDCINKALLVYNEFEDKIVEEKFMQEAVVLAKKAYKKDEVPIGAVVVHEGKIIAKAYNKREHGDATKHAEIIAISKACKKLKDFRLVDCDIYVTLEPCTMCMGAILNARIKNLYFGAYANKQNVLSAEEINQRAGLNHKVKIVGGVLKEPCEKLVKDYFAEKRK